MTVEKNTCDKKWHTIEPRENLKLEILRREIIQKMRGYFQISLILNNLHDKFQLKY